MSKKTNTVQELSLEEIRPGRFQPRVLFDEDTLAELAASIREDGLLQPITVRPIEDPEDPEINYEIIAGERRWRAFRMLKKSTIPAIIKDLDDRQTAIASLTENLQRASLTAIEEARGYKKLIEELKMKQQEVADRVGKSRPTISNMLRLLNLHKDVVYLIETGQIEAGQARPLVMLKKEEQLEAAEQVIKKGLNSRQAELLVKRTLEKDAQKEEESEDSEDNSFEEIQSRNEDIKSRLKEVYGEDVKVTVSTTASGVTRITFSVDEENLDDTVTLLAGD